MWVYHKIAKEVWEVFVQYDVAYNLPSLVLRGPNLFQYDNDPVHKVSSMKAWFARVVVKEHKWLIKLPLSAIGRIASVKMLILDLRSWIQ